MILSLLKDGCLWGGVATARAREEEDGRQGGLERPGGAGSEEGPQGRTHRHRQRPPAQEEPHRPALTAASRVN